MSIVACTAADWHAGRQLLSAAETAASAASEGASGQAAASQRSLYGVRCDDGRWSLVSPAGQPFFSVSVSVVNQGRAEHEHDAANPAYGAWRRYESSAAWADSTLQRLKSWGFTTVGGWSDFAVLTQSPEQSLYLTPVLHLGSTVGAPWLDMWDEKNLARMERLAVERIDPLRDDPRVIGYYSDNEIGWWNATLWQMTLEQPAASGQRQRLVALLRQTYEGDWNRLMADFIAEGCADWDELERGGTLLHRPGSGGIRMMRQFLALMAQRYYQLMDETIRRHDPDALFLGDRYQSFYYPEVAGASAPYVDVASTNLNASWNDGQFLRSYLDTLHRLTGKPLLVSEFYSAAMNNRSGNRNATSGFPVVETQEARAATARRTLEALARLPYVVGVEWFQYYDEPPLGRADGEDYNFGLVDIYDQPYEEVIGVFKSFDAARAAAAGRQTRPDATQGAPPAPPEPLSGLEFMEALKAWDRQRAFVPSASETPLGDLYVSWTPEAVYLGLYAVDTVEKAYYAEPGVPLVDRAVWQAALGDGAVATARIGGGERPVVDDPEVRVECLSGVDNNTRLIAVMRLSAERAGREQFTPGDIVELRSTFVTHGGVHRNEWRAIVPLAE